MNRTPGATLLPFIIAAPSRRSSIRALVQDPRKTWSTLTCSRTTSGSGRTLSGEYGHATIGGMSVTSISTVRSKTASASERRGCMECLAMGRR